MRLSITCVLFPCVRNHGVKAVWEEMVNFLFYGVLVLISCATTNCQHVSTQCDVGPVCFPIELLSTYFNLPQLNVMLI